MLLVEALRSWETRGAPSPKLEELVTRLRPRVEMESEADLGWNGRGQLTGTREAAQSPSNALKEAKNKLLICRKGHKKRHDKAQHPFIPCEKLFRSSIIILREHHLTTEYCMKTAPSLRL